MWVQASIFSATARSSFCCVPAATAQSDMPEG